MKKHLPKILIVLIAIIAASFLIKEKAPKLLPSRNTPSAPKTVQSVTKTIRPQVMQRLTPHLNAISLTALPDKISLVSIKSEQQLQVYAHTANKVKHLKSYPFTAFSGKLGPKLKQGDRQIPEGRYKIEHLNPNSSYYLSMKVSYPNDFDRKMAKKDKRTTLGGDIFIHGKAVTIGCIPIGDQAIEELFVLAAHALPNGIEVIISPVDFRTQDKAPKLPGISWEQELYNSIRNALHEFPLSATDSVQAAYPEMLSYTVDPKEGNLRFYSKDETGQPFLNHSKLNQWLTTKELHLKFAANGGMFKADYAPLELYIENGKTIQKLNRTKKAHGNFYLQPNGVFSLTKDHEPQIVATANFKQTKALNYATQSGPMLVIDGAIHPKFNAPSKNVHLRNGVGLLPDGRLLFAMSKKRVNFYRLAAFFRDRGCRNALYLDGFVSRTWLPAKDWTQEDGQFGIMIAEVEAH